MRSLTALLLLALLAGCSGGGGDAAPEAGGLPSGFGRLCGVVVDETIRPVPDAEATVRAPDATVHTAVSGEDGAFCLDLTPGTYIVEVRDAANAYTAAQTTAEVLGGEETSVRILLTRLFAQDPYSEAFQFEGFIQCGYRNPQVSTQCFDDYSRFVVPGGLAPQLRETFDHRSFRHAVGPGWQAMILELVWEPSAQGTSDEMFIVTSFYNRSGTHWFGMEEGPSPQQLRLHPGEEHETRSGVEPESIPPEGRPDLFSYAGIGGGVAVGVSQSFRVFQHNFYYGSPPEEWSFVGGDEPPF